MAEDSSYVLVTMQDTFNACFTSLNISMHPVYSRVIPGHLFLNNTKNISRWMGDNCYAPL